MQTNPLWDRDDIQFARLLAEIKASGLLPGQMRDLRESMDCTNEDIHELFDRAEEAFAGYVNDKRDWCCDPHHASPCDEENCGGCEDDCDHTFRFSGTIAEAYEKLAVNQKNMETNS